MYCVLRTDGTPYRCTLYVVSDTLYHVPMYLVRGTLYRCTVYSIRIMPYTAYNFKSSYDQCSRYWDMGYSVCCTLYNVYCTMYTVHCTVYRVLRATYDTKLHYSNENNFNKSVNYTNTVQYTLYSVQCTLCNVHVVHPTDYTYINGHYIFPVYTLYTRVYFIINTRLYIVSC